MNQLLIDNPILTKYLRSRLRQPQLTYLLVVVFLVCGFILWMGSIGGAAAMGVPFTLLFMLQCAALHLGGTSQVASSIGQVNDSGILDFHRISPLPPATTAYGFVMGAPIREYLVAAVAVPFALVAALMSNVGLIGFLTTGIVLLTTTWLFHLLAMIAGLLAPRGKTRGTNTGLTMFIIFSGLGSSWIHSGIPIPGMLTAGPALIEALAGPAMLAGQAQNWPTFFGLPTPLYLQTLCYQLPLIGFLAIPVVRRMRSAQAALYSKGTAIAFLTVISVLNMGGIIGHKNIQAAWIIPSLLYINATFAMFLIGAVTPDQGAYMNHLRGANKSRLARPSMWTDAASNRSAVIALCGVTYAMVQAVQSLVLAAGGQVGGGQAAGQVRLDFLIPTGIAVSTMAYFGFASQYFRISMGRRHKGALFLLLFFLWVLPIMAGTICSISVGPQMGQTVLSLSPFYGLASSSQMALVASATVAVIFYGLLVREESRAWSKVKGTEVMSRVVLEGMV